MNGKKQIFLIVGLLIMLIVIWTLVINSPKKNPSKTMKSAEESGLEFKVILEMVEDLKSKESVMEFSYEEDNDPFSLEKKNTSGKNMITSRLLGGFTLKGILWDSQKPLAIINGEVIGEGKMIKGIKIKRIEPSHVVLEVEGEEKLLFIEGVEQK